MEISVKYYVQIRSDASEAFWKVEQNKAERVDVSMSRFGIHEAESEDAVIPMLESRFPGSKLHSLKLAPGEYYPRMARPNSSRLDASPGPYPGAETPALRRARSESTGQLHALVEQIQQIFRTVHPVEENYRSFGHEVRNTLILACMEAEAQWKNILIESHYAIDRPNTNDYVKLLNAMKLDEYEVGFPYYPWLEPIAPFKDWSDGCPTRSLDWYNAYNLVKHDRERMFREATLKRALDAVTACFVMLCAQYGREFALQGDAALDAFFCLTGAPRWDPSEIYVPYAPPTPRDFPF
ncbi:hypothetical protein [Methylosinus sp. RM1]|uniref:hypothetical protein n=1 Tax=Methylosinus sp. RM1 TaxID=2583817 RepID=UPI0014086223|nr:hypothetical protein [Methylosinus sp. RM1]